MTVDRRALEDSKITKRKPVYDAAPVPEDEKSM